MDQAKERAAGRAGNVGGLYEADHSLWKSVTEVDNMIVDVLPDGRIRPAVMEQVKAGVKDAPADAAAQNATAKQAMAKVAAGDTAYRLYDRVGKNELGADRTPDFELSDVAKTDMRTRGLPGKGFDEVLDVGITGGKAEHSREALVAVARELLADALQAPKGKDP